MTDDSKSVIKILATERILLAAQKRRIKFQIATLQERRRRQGLLIDSFRKAHRNPQTGAWNSIQNKAHARTLFEQYGNLGVRIKSLGGERAAKTGRRDFESG